MAKTLLERAERIRDETGIMHNTHGRVGGVLVDLIEECNAKSKRIDVLEKEVKYLTDVVDDIQLRVSPKKVVFPSTGGTETVTVRAFIDWIVI